jgi:hypothetical protein
MYSSYQRGLNGQGYGVGTMHGFSNSWAGAMVGSRDQFVAS